MQVGMHLCLKPIVDITRTKTGVSVSPQKVLMSSKKFFKKCEASGAPTGDNQKIQEIKEPIILENSFQWPQTRGSK